MATVENTEEDTVKRPIPMLKVITGGRGTPPASGDNWLSPLQKNAVFTCKQKGIVDVLLLLIVVFKHDKTMVLADGLNSNPRMAVDPVEFCKKYSLFEVIEEGGEDPLRDNENITEEAPIRPD